MEAAEDFAEMGPFGGEIGKMGVSVHFLSKK